MSLLNIFENQILPLVSLSKFDESWVSTLGDSAIFGIWLKLKSFCQKNLALLSPMSSICELISFAMVVLLFLVLPAPQFADDKGILALLVISAFAIRSVAAILSNSQGYKPSALDIAVLAFLAMNIVATGASHYLAPSIKGLSKMAVYFCAYFLFMSVLQKSTRKRSLIVLSSVLLAGTLVSLYGIYQYKIGVAPLATWEDPNVEDKTTRVYSTLKNPNLLAGYLIPLLPLSLSLAIMSFCQKGWKKLLTLPALGASAAIALCCVFTGSRGGYMGIAAGLAALGLAILSSVWAAKAKLRPLLVVVVLAIPAILLVVLHKFPHYEARILSIFAGSEHSSNAYRFNVYRSSIKMFLDSWWLGVGPGNSTFKMAYGLYMRSGFDALGTYCVPLEVAVETGILGLAAFAWMIVGALGRAHENFWGKNHGADRWIAAGAAAGLVGMMVHGLVDTVYYRPQVQFVFWLLLALCIRSTGKELSEQSSPNSDRKEASLQDQNSAA